MERDTNWKTFLVIATQNPAGYEAPSLPESQLDRFLLRLSMDHLMSSEIDLLLDQLTDDPDFRLQAVMTRQELTVLQQYVRELNGDRKIAGHIVD